MYYLSFINAIVRKMQMKKVFMYFDNHRFRSTEFRKVVFKIRLKK